MEGKRLNRAKAIRQKCLDCCCWQQNEVKQCERKACPLWRYRMGREERDELYYASRKAKETEEDEEVDE